MRSGGSKNPLVNSQIVIDTLTQKGVKQPCPRCSQSQFSIVGESVINISSPVDTYTAVPAQKSTIPIIIIGCDNCGYIIQHAKGPLGFLKWHERSII